jgi:hypothetical protein
VAAPQGKTDAMPFYGKVKCSPRKNVTKKELAEALAQAANAVEGLAEVAHEEGLLDSDAGDPELAWSERDDYLADVKRWRQLAGVKESADV